MNQTQSAANRIKHHSAHLILVSMNKGGFMYTNVAQGSTTLKEYILAILSTNAHVQLRLSYSTVSSSNKGIPVELYREKILHYSDQQPSRKLHPSPWRPFEGKCAEVGALSSKEIAWSDTHCPLHANHPD